MDFILLDFKISFMIILLLLFLFVIASSSRFDKHEFAVIGYLPEYRLANFDYDGVLTDCKVYIINNDFARTANVRDGYAMQLAIKKGYRVAIISGGKSDGMELRMNALNVTDVFLGISDKLTFYKKYLTDNSIDPQSVLYMGDDIPDYQVMLAAALPVCPADAAEEIKSISAYISHRTGGNGCARDVIEQVLKSRGDWFDGEAFHW